MCFGMEETGKTTTNTTGTSSSNLNVNNVGTNNSSTTGTTTATANPAVADAAIGNLDFVRRLQENGFQGYTGQQVASLDPAQQATIDAAQRIANNGTGAAATSLIDRYSSAPAQSVSASTISSAMSPYMNQYVMQALAPQLHQMDINNAAQNAATNAQATSSGAYGDARAGIQASTDAFGQNVAREGLIGSAYNNAFNTAIAAGAQDVANNLAAQNANAGYAESALARALGGAGALQNLQTQQMGTQTAANSLAGQNTAQQQAQLTAMYNQWLMAQQYPFQTAQLTNQTIGQAASAMPASTTTTGATQGNTTQTGSTVGSGTTTQSGTSTEEKPNNSGWGLAGSLLSSFI